MKDKNEIDYSGSLSLAIADDHPFVREFLIELMESKWDEACIHQVDNYRDLLELVSKEPIEILILDFAMPGGNGHDAIEEVKRVRPEIKLIIFSGAMSSSNIFDALIAGADAYIPKSIGMENLLRVIEIVASGGSYVPAFVVADLLKNSEKEYRRKTSEHKVTHQLSTRELELLSYIANGYPNKVIAERLSLSESSIKQIIRTLFKKLEAKNRTEAVVIAMRSGMVTTH